MSTPNTCQICEEEYGPEDLHVCDRATLIGIVKDQNERLALYELDSDRLDWLDEDEHNLGDVLEYIESRAMMREQLEVRDAIDDLRELEDEADE